MRLLRARERVHVGDVRDRVGEGARPRDVVRHRTSLPILPPVLVAGLVEQRLHRRMLKELRRPWMVEDLLEGRVHALGLPDLLYRAAIVAGVGRRRLLGAQDERLDGGQIRQPLVAVHMPKDDVEQCKSRPGGEEVLHVGVPWTVETGHEGEPGVIVEEDETRLVNGLDGDVIVARSVAGCVLQVQERAAQRRSLTGLYMEEQTELAGRADAQPRVRRTG